MIPFIIICLPDIVTDFRLCIGVGILQKGLQMQCGLVIVPQALVEHADIDPLVDQLGIAGETFDVLPRQLQGPIIQGELLVDEDEIVHRKLDEIG